MRTALLAPSSIALAFGEPLEELAQPAGESRRHRHLQAVAGPIPIPRPRRISGHDQVDVTSTRLVPPARVLRDALLGAIWMSLFFWMALTVCFSVTWEISVREERRRAPLPLAHSARGRRG